MPSRSLEQIDSDLSEMGAVLDATRENLESVECVQLAKLERRLSKLEASVREALTDLQWTMDRVSRLERGR